MGDAGLFRSVVEWEVFKAWMDSKRRAEDERRAEAGKRLAIYHDAWRDILDDALRDLFIPANYANIKLSANVTQNIVKRIVDEVSVVYKRPASRSLHSADGESIESPAFSALDYDDTMDLANKYVNLMNRIGVIVLWDDVRKCVRLSLLTPADTTVYQRDGWPEEAAAFMYRVEAIDSPFGDSVGHYVYWDDEQHFIIDENGNRHDPSADGSNPEMKNPYGVMPVVWISKALRPGMFWDPDDGSDMIDATIKQGIRRTLKDYAFKMQSFKQPWIRNPSGQIPAEVAMDPAKVWLLGPEGDVGYLDMTADFAALDASIALDVDATLSAYGLSASSFASQSAESGVALEIRNRTLQDRRSKQIDIFRKAEARLFDLIRIVNNTWSDNKIPEEALFSVDFVEPEVYISPDEQRKRALWDMEHGLLSPAQFYVQFNPDADESTAGDIIAGNLASYSAVRDAGYVAPVVTDAESEVE